MWGENPLDSESFYERRRAIEEFQKIYESKTVDEATEVTAAEEIELDALVEKFINEVYLDNRQANVIKNWKKSLSEPDDVLNPVSVKAILDYMLGDVMFYTELAEAKSEKSSKGGSKIFIVISVIGALLSVGMILVAQSL
jgi:hypothetical protein